MINTTTAVRILATSTSPVGRVVLLPPAASGPTAAFRGWGGCAPKHLEVLGIELPGRGSRLLEAPHRSFADMLHETLSALAAREELPTVIVGHSLGGLIALEVAKVVQPASVVVAHTRSPVNMSTGDIDHDDYLVNFVMRDLEKMRAFARIPEVLELVERTLRSDLHAVAGHDFGDHPTLDSPLLVVSAIDDPIAPPSSMRGWERVSTGHCSYLYVDGGHHAVHLAGVRDHVIRWAAQYLDLQTPAGLEQVG